MVHDDANVVQGTLLLSSLEPLEPPEDISFSSHPCSSFLRSGIQQIPKLFFKDIFQIMLIF